MNKVEIREVMAIIRPAIWAMYGRDPLNLTGFAMVEFGESGWSGWFEVEGPWLQEKLKYRYYTAKLEDGNVTHLSTGELHA